MRVLLDTNILISYFLRSPTTATTIGRLIQAATLQVFTILLPIELLDEFNEKITTKPYLAARINAREAQELVDALRTVAILLPPLNQPAPKIVRDSDDDYLLAHARAAQADYLVTGDADLLALGDAVAPLRILTPAEFVQLLG